MATIYLIPTPLAPDTNHLLPVAYLRDLLRPIDCYFVENERTARRFLSSLAMEREIRELRFFVLDKDTTPAQVSQYFTQIGKGVDAAVLSEAGAPCIADPGMLAVAYAHQHKIQVMPIPGPSAILLALMGSGFGGQQFTFHGYLPVEEADAAKRLKDMEKDAQKGYTQIFMETPFRNNKLLALVVKTLQPNTQLCIAANLTSPEQLMRSHTVVGWSTQLPDLHKQPCVFAIAKGK